MSGFCILDAAGMLFLFGRMSIPGVVAAVMKSRFDLNMTIRPKAEHGPVCRIGCDQKAHKHGDAFIPLFSNCFCNHAVHDTASGFKIQD